MYIGDIPNANAISRLRTNFLKKKQPKFEYLRVIAFLEGVPM